MNGCVIFGGTTEGRMLAEFCAGHSFPADVFTATEYGASLLERTETLRIHAGRLNEEEIGRTFAELKPSLCIDATHPFACEVSAHLRKVCGACGTEYIRVRRDSFQEGEPGQHGEIVRVDSMEEAASFLSGQEGRILVTTGSKDLKAVSGIRDAAERCYVRVLPSEASIRACAEAGFSGKHVIAMQGPFGEKLNEAMISELMIRWVLTKDSGEEGGCPAKCRAAAKCGAGVVLIGRPCHEEDALPFGEVTGRLERFFSASGTVTPGRGEAGLVGMGPGDGAYLTASAREWILTADVICGGRRLIRDALRVREASGVTARPRTFACISGKETADALRAAEPFRKAAVVCSGDISFYSAAKAARPLLMERYSVSLLPGVSSASLFLAKAGVAFEDVLTVSVHGRERNLVPLIRGNRYVLALSGGENSVSETCGKLVMTGLADVSVTVGADLSYETERMERGKAADFAGRRTGPLSIALYENPAPREVTAGFGIADGEWIRGNVPMTKKEIRCSALSALQLRKGDVFFDIGAGTGSVSVEAALHVPDGSVYAIEKKKEAAELIRANRLRFACGNLEIIEGSAPEALAGLPAPDAVLIGGSGGNLAAVIAQVFEMNPEARIAVTSVTAETDAAVTHLRAEDPAHTYERTEIWTVTEREAGPYHLRQAGNPVSVTLIRKKTEI